MDGVERAMVSNAEDKSSKIMMILRWEARLIYIRMNIIRLDLKCNNRGGPMAVYGMTRKYIVHTIKIINVIVRLRE